MMRASPLYPLLQKLISLPLILVCATTQISYAQSSDIILQGFHWNAHPGDITDLVDGGVWWDSLAAIADEISGSGIGTVWIPPIQKSFGGVLDMGYAPYDFFDVGEYDQRGSTRTRYGNRRQLDRMVDALHDAPYGGLRIMADLVLNHRGGSDRTPGGQYRQDYEVDYHDLVNNDPGFGRKDARWWGYTYFLPASGRWPADAPDFHPNATHSTIEPLPNPESMERYPVFFEDMCFFNHPDTVGPPDGWYNGPHTLSHVGDSAIVWARWLLDDVHADEIRLDAVRHIDPEFIAALLVELRRGHPDEQPFAAGEIFSYETKGIADYHERLGGFATGARMAYFDFPLRGSLKAMTVANGDFDVATLGAAGLNGLDLSYDVVTFVDNHDVKRTGWAPVRVEQSPPCGTGQFRGSGPAEDTCFKSSSICDEEGEVSFGDTCLQTTVDGHEDPAGPDRFTLAYPYIMAATGRPMIYWDDWIGAQTRADFAWLAALRSATAAGPAESLRGLNPWFDPGTHASDAFVLTREGSAERGGLVLAISDRADIASEGSLWVDAPFRNMWVRDYSDRFMFDARQVYSDGRVHISVRGRDYAWYAPTGLYPRPPLETESVFDFEAEPGGCPHWVVLQTADSLRYRVGARPIRAGDQLAITGELGGAAGIGRVGQSFEWDGVHDMVVEVLGGLPADQGRTAGGLNGLASGERLGLLVYSSDDGEVMKGESVFSSPGGALAVRARRPSTRADTIETVLSAAGSYTCLGVSRIVSFSGSPSR